MSNDRMFQATRQRQALVEHALLEDRERGYDTEDAPSQSETDEEIKALRHCGPQRTVQLMRVRDQSPVNIRSHSARVVAVSGVERSFQQRPLCVIPGCSFPARVSAGHAFCPKTCSRLV